MEEGDTDRSSTSLTAPLTLCVPDEEIQRRLSQVKHIHKEATPALRRYAALVTSADQGAVLKTPDEL